MKSFLQKIGTAFSIISGFALVLYLYRLFSTKSSSGENSFPKAAEKAAAEKEVKEIKEEIKELEQKTYSDEDIKKLFNEN